jgi:hypothetical protein
MRQSHFFKILKAVGLAIGNWQYAHGDFYMGNLGLFPIVDGNKIKSVTELPNYIEY